MSKTKEPQVSDYGLATGVFFVQMWTYIAPPVGHSLVEKEMEL